MISCLWRRLLQPRADPLERLAGLSDAQTTCVCGSGGSLTLFLDECSDFRRCSALKLRYMLPIQVPSQILSPFPPSLLQLPSVASGSRSQKGTPLSSPKKSAFPTKITESKSTGGAAGLVPAAASAPSPLDAKALPDLVLFDAQVVARKDEGWEDMLERVLLRWMWKAIGEKRKALPAPIG